MDHFIIRFFPEDRLDLIGLLPSNTNNVPAIVMNDPPAENLAVWRFKLHDLSFLKIPFDLYNSTGQQTLFCEQRLISPAVDYDTAAPGR